MPTEEATSGRIGPASGRGAGWPGCALASGVAGSLGSVIGAERDEIYAKQVAVEPQFGEYQRSTKRLIPVLELRRTAD